MTLNAAAITPSELFEKAGVGLCLLDPAYRILAVNSQWLQSTGLAAEQVMGKDVLELFPSTRDAFGDIYARARAGETIALPRHSLQLQGKESWWEGSLSPLSMEGGTGVLITARNITTEVKEEEALRESEERFRKIFEDGPLGMAIVDSDCRLVQANAMLCKMLGRSASELAGLSVRDVTHPEDVEADLKLMRRMFDGEMTSYRLEKRYIKGNGEAVWTKISVSAIRGSAGRPMYTLKMVEDITERRKADRFREEYVSLISHDLRTPLTGVQGHAQFILRAVDNAALVRRSAEAIFASAKRMNVLIEDLVDSARLESGQLKLHPIPLDLRFFITELQARLAPALEVDRIRIEIPEELPRVLADQDRLERIVINLLANAQKYSPSDSQAVVAAERGAHEITISVIDRGVGIAPAELPHIFDRFYRAKSGGGVDGLGLGLYITRMLIEAQGGRIWVVSEPGTGSTFHFTLPLAREHTEATGKTK